MSKSTIKTIITGIIVAAIWGYFSDLRNGEIGWFIGRLIFMPLFLLFLDKVLRNNNANKNTTSED